MSNPHFVAYESLLRDLHRLVGQEKGDGPEAQELRGRMDAEADHLSPSEVRRLNELSGDLYTLHEPEEVYEEADPDTWTPFRVSTEVKSAWDRDDWASALAALRKGPSLFPPAQTAYFRARAYEALGHKETALAFMQHAARLNPRNARYVALVLELLMDQGRVRDADLIVDTYAKDPETNPALLIESASVLYRVGTTLAPDERLELFGRAADALRTALGQKQTVDSDVAIFGHVLLGACLEELGQYDRAHEVYADALRIDPVNDLVVLARTNLYAHLRHLPTSGSTSATTRLVAPRFDEPNDEITTERRELVRALAAARAG